MTKIFQVKSAALMHPGRRRSHNEDFVTYFEPGSRADLEASGYLYVVADGVGGAARGERASQYAAEKVLYEYYQDTESPPGQRLKKAMRGAGNDIFEFAEKYEYYRRMATTLVAAAIHGTQMTVANVGDSRAYLIHKNEIWQITQDHTTASELVRDGVLSEAEAHRSKAKNRLTRSLGGEPDALVDIFADIPLAVGDVLLLCSDGLTRYIAKNEIPKMLEEESPETAVENFVNLANERGGVDNIAVVMVKLEAELSTEDLPEFEPRGHIPTEVEWESADTQPLEMTKQRRRRSWGLEDLFLNRRQDRIAFLIIFLFICAFVFGTLWISSRWGGPAGASPGTVLTATAPLNATPAGAAVPSEDINPTLASGSTEAPVNTPALTSTSVAAAPKEVCVFQTEEGDTLEVILFNFGIVDDGTGTYYYYSQCELEANREKRVCSGKTLISDPDSIDIGWWVEIPLPDDRLPFGCNENERGRLAIPGN